VHGVIIDIYSQFAWSLDPYYTNN